MASPKWVTPERKTRLTQVQEKYAGLCLKGHQFCPVQEHYQWVRTRAGWGVLPATPDNIAATEERYRIVRDGWLSVPVPVYESELASLGDAMVEEIIASWIADDRDAAVEERRRAGQTLNDGTFGHYGRQWDPVARDVAAQGRPSYYLVAMGIDGVHFRPVAVVKIPGTGITLHVDVAKAFLTRSQRRHARRHGRPEVTVEALCHAAVQAWWHR